MDIVLLNFRTASVIIIISVDFLNLMASSLQPGIERRIILVRSTLSVLTLLVVQNALQLGSSDYSTPNTASLFRSRYGNVIEVIIIEHIRHLHTPQRFVYGPSFKDAYQGFVELLPLSGV